MKSEPLNIHDKTFLINRLIQQAPKHTLIREFFKNAEENACLAAEGNRKIRIYPVDIAGVRKLAFWNTGIGMDDEELKRATDLSSSIGKSMGLDGNYGIGAKVSGLTMSPEGIRYRSCKDGVVSQILIGYDDQQKTYVRFAFDMGLEPSQIVLDVTDTVMTEGMDVSFDWTEVVLYGETEDHDTVSEPFGKGKRADRSAIPTAIFRRFSKFKPGIDVRVDVAMTKGGGKDETGKTRQLRTLTDILEKLPNHEYVTHEDTGVTVHFIHDPKADTSSHSLSSRANAAAASTTFCALVHKSERYDFKTKIAWSSAAPNFGIPFGSKVLSIEIELPDAMASPNQYRNGLTLPEDRSDLFSADFTSIVKQVMPEWVKEVIRSASPESNDNLNDLQSALQKLLDEHRVPTKTIQPSNRPIASADCNNDAGVDSASVAPLEGVNENERDGENELHIEDSTPRSRRARPKKLKIAPDGAKPSKTAKALERAPEIEVIYDPEEVIAKDMKGRAGRYYKSAQKIFVNGNYPIIERTAIDLEKDLRGYDDPEIARQAAKDAAIHSMAFRVGKTVCFAIAKRLNDDWSDDALELATSPECLSMAADDYRPSMSEAKKLAKSMIKIANVDQGESEDKAA